MICTGQKSLVIAEPTNGETKIKGKRVMRIYLATVLVCLTFIFMSSALCLAQPPPSNDLCDNPIGPLPVPSVTGGTTIGATFDDVGVCGTSNTTNGVWYTVIGTGNRMTASTCGSLFNYDTKISVFCDDCDDLVCITGNDDNCSDGASGLLSTVAWCSQAGATYRILVHGFSSNFGNFELSVFDDSTPCGEPDGECPVPPLDDFLSYRVDSKRRWSKFKFKPRYVFLQDELEKGIFLVIKPLRLLNPASKDGNEISDPDTHLVSYWIMRAWNEPKHERVLGIQVSNQFGDLSVDTIKPDRLLIPSAKGLDNPVDPPDPETHHVDHFKCYEVKVTEDTPEFEPRQVTLADQFENKSYLVKRPTRLCIPVNKNCEGIKNPENHLMCYRIERSSGEPWHRPVPGIHINNQLGPLKISTIKETELCVPSMEIDNTNLPSP